MISAMLQSAIGKTNKKVAFSQNALAAAAADALEARLVKGHPKKPMQPKKPKKPPPVSSTEALAGKPQEQLLDMLKRGGANHAAGKGGGLLWDECDHPTHGACYRIHDGIARGHYIKHDKVRARIAGCGAVHVEGEPFWLFPKDAVRSIEPRYGFVSDDGERGYRPAPAWMLNPHHRTVLFFRLTGEDGRFGALEQVEPARVDFVC